MSGQNGVFHAHVHKNINKKPNRGSYYGWAVIWARNGVVGMEIKYGWPNWCHLCTFTQELIKPNIKVAIMVGGSQGLTIS